MGEAVVIAAVREFANRFLGRGDATITVPSFDGALKPNQKLESAETLLTCESPQDLATDGSNLFIADGPRHGLRGAKLRAADLGAMCSPGQRRCRRARRARGACLRKSLGRTAERDL